MLKARHNSKQTGLTIFEVTIVLAVGTALMALAMPTFNTVIRDYRRDAAIQQVARDLRLARSQAISTGWQYRVIGFPGGAASDNANQYRLMARSSSAVAWPADDAAPFESATQLARSWVEFGQLHPQVTLSPGSTAPFSVAFDSRGARVEITPNMDPLIIEGQSAETRSVGVSAVGRVTTE